MYNHSKLGLITFLASLCLTGVLPAYANWPPEDRNIRFIRDQNGNIINGAFTGSYPVTPAGVPHRIPNRSTFNQFNPPANKPVRTCLSNINQQPLEQRVGTAITNRGQTQISECRK